MYTMRRLFSENVQNGAQGKQFGELNNGAVYDQSERPTSEAQSGRLIVTSAAAAAAIAAAPLPLPSSDSTNLN